ncbi:ABC transporter permease [Planctomonas sp. JC2975]|uniref:ABC transporter permease n=1 Tax=Planctomonas sp. JC2975 TaxID=2729626 RepID=UPI0014756198|nr:ABC transporter permease [Planctomonas sp. JC2975]NNC12899.1 ABC transporter permease [Planctomonas sp. JC2975]
MAVLTPAREDAFVRRRLSTLLRRPQSWAVVILLALVIINVAVRPDFFALSIRRGALYGAIPDIIRDAAPLMLVSLGMLLVVAVRGIDLSVGAVLSVGGAVALAVIAGSPDPASFGAVALGIGAGLGVGILLGAWNGMLVAAIGVQPIIATLVLMLAGRGLAMLVTHGQVETVVSPPYAWIASGTVLGIPAPTIIAAAVVAVVAVLLRRTALGTMIESIGANPVASRMAGLRVRVLTATVYTVSGLLAAASGLIVSSDIMSADASNAGLGIEVDAILAVVIGGTSLRGGRFSIGGTVLGVLTVQVLTSTVTYLGTSPATSPLFEGVIIIAVCLLQAPRTSALLQRVRAGWRGIQ